MARNFERGNFRREGGPDVICRPIGRVDQIFVALVTLLGRVQISPDQRVTAAVLNSTERCVKLVHISVPLFYEKTAIGRWIIVSGQWQKYDQLRAYKYGILRGAGGTYFPAVNLGEINTSRTLDLAKRNIAAPAAGKQIFSSGSEIDERFRSIFFANILILKCKTWISETRESSIGPKYRKGSSCREDTMGQLKCWNIARFW